MWCVCFDETVSVERMEKGRKGGEAKADLRCHVAGDGYFIDLRVSIQLKLMERNSGGEGEVGKG